MDIVTTVRRGSALLASLTDDVGVDNPTVVALNVVR